jgi:two-component system sensor histidine kinase DegS
VAGTLPPAAAEIVQTIDEDIGGLEDRLSGTVENLSILLADIEQRRAGVISSLEEFELERSLGGVLENGPVDESNGEELRGAEDCLTGQYTGVSALFKQLNGFVHLLTASREQFRSRSELPGIEDGQRLAIRHAMIQAQEDERRRLAREIHDGPAQVLANAIIGLEFIERSLEAGLDAHDGRALAEIERVKASMREGLTEIRRFIFDLQPTMLSQRGLAATVEHYVQIYRHLFAGQVHLAIPKRLPNLTTDQEMTAFRVIQESLQNVHRHSRATETRVIISADSDALEVDVRDNGQGFRQTGMLSSPTGGFGVSGMRERAEVIGASLTISSGNGVGTAVQLRIPLHGRARSRSVKRGQRRGLEGQGGMREPGTDPGR